MCVCARAGRHGYMRIPLSIFLCISVSRGLSCSLYVSFTLTSAGCLGLSLSLPAPSHFSGLFVSLSVSLLAFLCVPVSLCLLVFAFQCISLCSLSPCPLSACTSSCGPVFLPIVVPFLPRGNRKICFPVFAMSLFSHEAPHLSASVWTPPASLSP